MLVQLKLVRDIFRADCTHGSLYINEKFECFTLEDVVRGDGNPATVDQWKIDGKSAIPYGTYLIGMHDSPHFGKVLPWLRNVPGYEYILIHSGNTAVDTEGCVLVGQDRALSSVANSRVAFDHLFPQIKEAHDRGDYVTIDVTRR